MRRSKIGAWHGLLDRVFRAVSPLGMALMGPRAMELARYLPPPPRRFFRSFRCASRAWEPFGEEVPPELASVPGILRDREAEDAAFAADPLPTWAVKHREATEFAFRYLWRSVLPILPILARAQQRAKDVSANQTLSVRTPSSTDESLTEALKECALQLGASAVGVATYDPRYAFREFLGETSGDRVVVIAVEQEWEATQTAPSARSERSVFIAYIRCYEIVTELARFLQERGYRARPHDIVGQNVMIHYGVASGLGQLGLNGQLLTPQAGSRCRLLTLDTDAPLAIDEPVDYGINGICDACKACVERCPSGAIPRRRRMHRGVEKIKINTARCFPLVAQADGCAVCMKVCPIQRYGLPSVMREYRRSGRILGRGSSELEAYTWPLDARNYQPGERPPLPKELMDPPNTSWGFREKTSSAQHRAGEKHHSTATG